MHIIPSVLLSKVFNELIKIKTRLSVIAFLLIINMLRKRHHSILPIKTFLKKIDHCLMVFMKDASFRSLFNFILSELIFLYIDIICTFSEKNQLIQFSRFILPPRCLKNIAM